MPLVPSNKNHFASLVVKGMGKPTAAPGGAPAPEPAGDDKESIASEMISAFESKDAGALSAALSAFFKLCETDSEGVSEDDSSDSMPA